jgi:hypothetical protein
MLQSLVISGNLDLTRRAGALHRARLPSVFSSCRMGVLPVHGPCAADAWFCSVQSSCKSCLPLEAAWLTGVGCLYILVSDCDVLPALLCVLLLLSLLYESVCCFGVGRMVPFEREKYPMILHLRCYHAIILKKVLNGKISQNKFVDVQKICLHNFCNFQNQIRNVLRETKKDKLLCE